MSLKLLENNQFLISITSDLTSSQQNVLKAIYLELGRKAVDTAPSETKNLKLTKTL